LQRSEQKNATPLRSLSFTAALACGTIRTSDLVLFDVKFSIDEEGVFDLNPVTMHVFGGLGSSNIRTDFSGSVPEYHIHYSLSKFRCLATYISMPPRTQMHRGRSGVS
jgi:hypothetical protein